MNGSRSLAEEGRLLVERRGGRWTDRGGLCRCPAHEDRSPSLSVRVGRSRLLLHCFAGCSPRSVIEALASAGHLEAGGPCASGDQQNVPGYSPTRDAALRLWRASRPITGTAAEAYLSARALHHDGGELRYAPRAPFGRHPQTIFAPALIAAIRDEAGLIAVHRTRLDRPDASGANGVVPPRKAALGALASGAVRLAPPASRLGLAEGIENALSATLLTGIPCWATLGAARFGRVALPPGVAELVLFLDHDDGGRRAERLAMEAFGARLAVHARYPDAPGADWNDVLRAQARRTAGQERKGGG